MNKGKTIEYLRHYCAHNDCKGQFVECCDLCMYNKGREDAMNDDGVPKQLLKMGYKKGWTDAIDELIKELYPCKYKYNDDCYLCANFAHCMIFKVERIADRLKEENNDKIL